MSCKICVNIYLWFKIHNLVLFFVSKKLYSFSVIIDQSAFTVMISDCHKMSKRLMWKLEYRFSAFTLSMTTDNLDLPWLFTYVIGLCR